MGGGPQKSGPSQGDVLREQAAALSEAQANLIAMRTAILGQAAFITDLRREIGRLNQQNAILWGQVHGQPVFVPPMFGVN